MKTLEIRQMTKEELETRLADLKHELFMARVQRYTENAPDTAKVKLLKKDIARIKTILREAELGIGRALQAAAETKEG